MTDMKYATLDKDLSSLNFTEDYTSVSRVIRYRVSSSQN
jgi:hypothetical protein